MDLGVNVKLGVFGTFETSIFGLFVMDVATVVVTRLLLNQLRQKDLCVVVTDDSLGDGLVLLVGLIAGKVVVFQLKLKMGKSNFSTNYF